MRMGWPLKALILLVAGGIHATALAASAGALPLWMDSRFSGFDTISHVQRTLPALADQAELISHWSGYYNVNPLLLARLVESTATTDSVSIRTLARDLGAIASEHRERPVNDFAVTESLADALRGSLPLSPPLLEAALSAARADMAGAGPWRVQNDIADLPPALDLPFRSDLRWSFNGTHTWTGNDDGGPMSSIDFASSWSQSWGSDTSGDVVAAAHDGEVTVYSSCYVQVQHPNGWATRYYHLDEVTVRTGEHIRAGDPIAIYASAYDQAICQGGHSNLPHLHFALLRDGSYASLAGVALSGYLVHPGRQSYDADRDHMWLQKRGSRFYAFGQTIGRQPGDNTIDYRYNGMWYSPEHAGHGLNIEISEWPEEDTSRKAVFVALYTYDDDGIANFYVGNRDFERWRADEPMQIDLAQTAGGNFTDLAPIDFDDPAQYQVTGQVELLFEDCNTVWVDLQLAERTTGLPVDHAVELMRVIGVPPHVCDAASLPLP